MNGIDVSRWQGDIDWSAVKASGISNVILKLGGSDDGVYRDTNFIANYNMAKAYGFKIGVYWFVGPQFFTTDDGIREAENCIKMLDGRELDYPIYCDVEAPAAGNKTGITVAVLTFCGTIHDKYHREVGIYGSDISGFKDRMDYESILKYPYISLWVARYGSKPQYATKWDIWQSSSSGDIPGIKGRVDTDEFKFGNKEINNTPAPTTVDQATQVVTDNMTKELAHKIYDVIKDYL